MTDRELLEAAAKAAGWIIERWTPDGTALKIKGISEPFNALNVNIHSDCMSDALWLAVRLGLVVDCSRPSAGEPFKQHEIWLDELCDTATLTRLAIVRAAAEIGKAMP